MGVREREEIGIFIVRLIIVGIICEIFLCFKIFVEDFIEFSRVNGFEDSLSFYGIVGKMRVKS